MTKKRWGETAIAGLSVGIISSLVVVELPVFVNILTDILSTAGLVAGIVWVIKTIRSKKSAQNQGGDN